METTPSLKQFIKKQDGEEILAPSLFENLIDEGNFGTVYKVNINDRICALKQSKPNKISMEDLQAESENEFKTMSKLKNCDNIVKGHELIFLRNKNNKIREAYFLMDYCGDKTFKKLIYSSQFIKDEKELHKIVAQLVGAFAYMQSNQIVYRDLKPSNICINSNGDVIIIDFGTADFVHEKTEYNEFIAGTENYLAPEIHQSYLVWKKKIAPLETSKDVSVRTGYRERCRKIFRADVFSFGITILEIAGFDIKKANTECGLTEKLIIQFSRQYPSLSNLIEKVLKFDPRDRIDFLNLQDLLFYNNYCSFKFYTPVMLEDAKLEPSNFLKLEEIKSGVLPKFSKIFVDSHCLFDRKVDNTYLKVILKINEITKSSFSLDEVKKEMLEVFKNKPNISSFLDDQSQGELSRIIKFLINDPDILSKINDYFYQRNYERNLNFLKSLIIFSNKDDIWEVKEKYVYKLCSYVNSDRAREKRLSLVTGYILYWPYFSFALKEESSVKKLIEDQIENRYECDQILFRIKPNLKNRNNKLDVSSIAKHDAVLLFPFFKYRITRYQPFLFKNKYIAGFEVEEMDESALPMQLVWFDTNINTVENLTFQKLLMEIYKINPCIFFDSAEKATQYIKENKETQFLVITCGSAGEPFVKEIHKIDRVHAICVFCSYKEKHEAWFKKEIYTKALGVFTKIEEIFEILPYHVY